MFCFNDTMRYHLCPSRTDMREGINLLIGVVRECRGADVRNGYVFIFIGSSRRLIKLLHAENGGMVMYVKRLDAGRFRIPAATMTSPVSISTPSSSPCHTSTEPHMKSLCSSCHTGGKNTTSRGNHGRHRAIPRKVTPPTLTTTSATTLNGLQTMLLYIAIKAVLQLMLTLN